MKPGTRLNHYEIVGRLGAGGMGEVHVARDTKLGRDVALKLLPETLAADGERRARFEREARAVAALNHANIVTIYSVEEAVLPDAGESAGDQGSATVQFLTMELVDGRMLAELIPGGGLPLERFFEIAIPLTDAVSAAHQKGIAHRDLKPANVMITGEGVVKLLDFGLAKLASTRVGPDDELATAAATVVADRRDAAAGTALANAGFGADLTEAGTILGTVAYMSPEQAEGKQVDHRSDVFSLGVILYEMATGTRPFKGDTSLSVMSSIVKDAPAPITDLNTDLPRHLGRIIRRALEKDVRRRFQTALDLRNELDDLKREIDTGEVLPLSSSPTVHPPVAPAPTRARTGRVAPFVTAVLVIAAFGLGWFVFDGRGGAGLRVTTRRVAATAAYEFDPAISADGEWVVYAMLDNRNSLSDLPEDAPAGPRSDIFLQSIDGQNATNLTNTPEVSEHDPAFSPDGRRIAFRKGAGADDPGIWIMGLTGENPRLLSPIGAHPAWSADSSKIYAASNNFSDPRNVRGSAELWEIDIESGAKDLLFDHDGWVAFQPKPSPNHLRVAFWAVTIESSQRDIWTIPVGRGDPVAVTNDRAVDWNPTWSPDGRFLYFASDRGGSANIWRVAIDEASGEPQGQPEPLTSGGVALQGFLSISADGRRLLYGERISRRYLARASFDAATATVANDGVRLTRIPVEPDRPRVSPNGEQIAFVEFAAPQDIWVVNADGTGERKLTDDAFKDWGPRWLGDNETLYFRSDRDGNYDIWQTRTDRSGLQRVIDAPYQIGSMAPSRDGRWILFHGNNRGFTELVEIGDSGAGPPSVLPPASDVGGGFAPSDWSPDGTKVVGLQSGIVVYSPAGQRYLRLTSGQGAFPVFTPDGDVVYFTGGGLGRRHWLADAETAATRQIIMPPIQTSHLRILPGNERVVYIEIAPTEGDVWLLEIDEGS